MCSWEKLGSGPLRPTIPPGSASRDSMAPEAGGCKGDVLFYPLPAQNNCGSGWLHQPCIGHIGRLYFPWPKCPLSGALPGQTAHCFERYERVGARLYVTVLHLSLCSSKKHFTTKTNVQIHKCFFYREKNRDLNGHCVEAQIWPVNKTLWSNLTQIVNFQKILGYIALIH